MSNETLPLPSIEEVIKQCDDAFSQLGKDQLEGVLSQVDAKLPNADNDYAIEILNTTKSIAQKYFDEIESGARVDPELEHGPSAFMMENPTHEAVMKRCNKYVAHLEYKEGKEGLEKYSKTLDEKVQIVKSRPQDDEGGYALKVLTEQKQIVVDRIEQIRKEQSN